MKIPCHIGHNDMVYLQCVFTAVITGISFMAHSALIKLLTSVHLNVFMKTTLQRKFLDPLAALILGGGVKLLFRKSQSLTP